MLGSLTDADDAVQEAWLRLSRADSRGVENLRAWLTTVIARVCLNVLRSRESRREEPVTPQLADSIPSGDGGIGPEDEMLLADSVGIALLAVLDPEVVLRVDRGAGRAPARGPVVVRGAATVAARPRAHSRFARFCRVVLVNGAPGIVVASQGRIVTVATFKVENERIVEIEIVNDPARQREPDLAALEADPATPSFARRGAPG